MAGVYGCTMCPSDRFFKWDTKECLLACPSQLYYTDFVTRRCEKCHVDCLECTADLNTNCTICNNSKFLYYDTDHLCKNSCTIGYYQLIPLPNRCGKCHDYCSSCLSVARTDCDSCYNPYFFIVDQRTCDVQCPYIGYYASAFQCLNCHQHCHRCSGGTMN